MRTVLASITDAKGRPLARPPAISDIRILENGKAVEVIAVEPLRRAPVSPAQAPGPAPAPAAGPVPVRLPQYLYVDTATLQVRSVKAIASAFADNLDAVLRTGPLEIVVADPKAQVYLASTSDAAALRAALASLGRLQGRESIQIVRRDYLQSVQDSEMSKPRMPAQASIQEEVQLLQNALGSIVTWAETLPDDQPGIVYLGTDGFDSDPTEVYRRALTASQNVESSKNASQLLSEYGGTVTTLVAQADRALAAKGLRTVPVALGGVRAEFASSAANTHKVSSRSIAYAGNGAAVTYFARPIEPLHVIAAATGGEVVSTESTFAAEVQGTGGLYLVTFRTTAPADGTAHALAVTSADPGIQVGAPRYLAAGTVAANAAAKTTKALAAAQPSNAGLDVGVTVEAIGRAGRNMQGELSVSADLASITPALEKLGAGRVRVTIAVEVPGSAPFVSHDEADLDHSGGGTMWLYEAKFRWPPEATRVAVTVEELKTGASGTGVAELPKAP